MSLRHNRRCAMPLDESRTRVARDLLGWSRERLAEQAGVPVTSVEVLERIGVVREAEERRIRTALEREGIELRSGPGVLGVGVTFRDPYAREKGRREPSPG